MGIHVVIQPLAGYGAEVVSPSPGVRQLVAGGEGTTVLVQVPARIGGLSDTARFARRARRCVWDAGAVYKRYSLRRANRLA